jgi:hypothetical protein
MEQGIDVRERDALQVIVAAKEPFGSHAPVVKPRWTVRDQSAAIGQPRFESLKPRQET